MLGRSEIGSQLDEEIHTKQQPSAGMKHARASGSPFRPSPGQFINWCKDGENGAAGLPD
ncbi:hypothetical protein A6J33_020105 [Pantoea sp. FDAARGOS_194]|uniref:replication protein P n=1 Tax=Pantoea TaxID=53335 RepID=UPI000BB52DFA|nr:hypothetical protein A6J33_020105 [Pantoea sp. FDAARGOS_194]